MGMPTGTHVDLEDVQSGALHPRPSPYVGYMGIIRIDDAQAGREMLRRILPALDNAATPLAIDKDAWISLALSHHGLRALGVPQDSLASFPLEFQEGMAARAEYIGDVGESGPANWEPPFGTPNLHVALTALGPDEARLEEKLARARASFAAVPGLQVIWSHEVKQLPNGRGFFGFRDGLSYPSIEGVGIVGSNPQEPPLKAGEFLLGYPDETGDIAPMPRPEILGRNGTYLAFRKVHTKVAAWRQYLRDVAKSPEDEALIAAKMIGRWPSGAPLALSPDRDDPELGHDPARNNNFLYHDADDRGLKCPAGAHIRRANPRDASIVGVTRLHRIIRRGASYGPPLPEGVLEDDGVDRGLVGVFIGAHLDRQYEFIKRQWMNDGVFIGYPDESDPVAGQGHGAGVFTIPTEPIRRRVQHVPSFVVTRGGEYLFMPSLSAIRWLSEVEG